MRVAYLVSRFPTASETFIVRELDALADLEGVEVELGSLYPPKESFTHPGAGRWAAVARRPTPFASAAATVSWMLRRPLRMLGSAGAVIVAFARRPALLVRSLATLPVAAAHARALRRLGIDRIHAHFATYPTLAAWLCSRLLDVPYSFTAHAHDLYVDQSMLERKVRDASFVIAVSEFNRRFLREYGGDRLTPVHVIHCGIDPSEYAYRPRGVPAEGGVAALSVASLQEHKGHRVLLEALATAGGPLSRLRLTLAGGGEELRVLEALARELKLADRVEFRGPLGEPQVRALLEGADLFVLPSLVARDGQMEGLPVALIEAVACGMPVVASRLSGIPELIRGPEIGLLAEPGNVADLRATLERALDEPLTIADRRGRDLVESEFDVRASAARIAQLFRSAAPA